MLRRKANSLAGGLGAHQMLTRPLEMYGTKSLEIFTFVNSLMILL